MRISDWSSDVCSSDLREDVTGTDDIVRPFASVDCDRNRARAISGRDTRGHALAGLDRGGEGGLHAGAIVAAHRLELQSLDPRTVEREADQPASMRRTEVDCRGCGHLYRKDMKSVG